MDERDYRAYERNSARQGRCVLQQRLLTVHWLHSWHNHVIEPSHHIKYAHGEKTGMLVTVLIYIMYSLPLGISAQCRDTLTITLTGDILLDRGVRKAIENHGIDYLFSPSVDSVFKSSDIVIGNLECPATKIKRPVFKRFIFRSEPEWLEALRRHGVTHLNLANNHSIDQGREGLYDTKRNIEHYGMTAIGAGRNMAEAAREVLLADKPRPVYMLASLRLALENMSYLPEKICVSQEPVDSLIARIKDLRQRQPQCYIIVSLHWGCEHTLTPVPIQKIEARRIIDAGADCLVCHHTHTLQTIEEYRGKKIYYSIGNFIFDAVKPINTKGCIVKLTVTRNDATALTIPIEIKKCIPETEF